MRKIALWCTVFGLILAACAPAAQATEESLLPVDDVRKTPTAAPASTSPAEEAAISLLASTLNLPADQISILATEAVEWPDGCLGIQREGLMCTQAIVPGFKIMVQADGKTYEVRTNKSGSQAVLVQDAPTVGLLEKALVAQLASNLGLNPSDVSVISSSKTEFSDACLGVALIEQACAQVVTPGKVVILEANGFEFEYHVSEDGKQVQPATVALTWTREGGIAGFCNSLIVFLSGEVYGTNCRGTGETVVMMFPDLISPDEQAQFFEWAGELGSIDADASDPEGVADRMVVALDFFGTGNDETTDSALQALFAFAQRLYDKLYS